MKKIAYIFISLVFILTACQANDPHAIPLDEVLSSFEEQQLPLKESKVTRNDNIFGMKLNGVRPSFYDLDGKKLLVYIFNSTNKREEGLEDWSEKTASMDTVSYKVYEVHNVLLFYVYVDENLKSEIDNGIQNIMDKLSNS